MEADRRIRRTAVVGGGFAGWLAAIALTRKLAGQVSIHVVDSPESGTAGLAETTIPPMLELLRFLGIDQNDFIDKTQSTYCLAAKLQDWGGEAQSFWRPFGAFGALIERRPFYHFWHKAKAAGMQPRVESFSLEIAMSLGNRFIFPTNTLGVAQTLRYALNFDTALATRYLRTMAERAGVIRLEKKLVNVTRREDGFVDELEFEDGGKLRADLFIDNTGARAQLIGETLGVPYESWQQWLPADRLLSAPAPLEDSRPPYVRIGARAAGWTWRAPLQQMLSVGHVFSSAQQSDDAALAELRAAAGADFIAEPRRIEFTPGRRRATWEKNVVALGAAAGFLEPLVQVDAHLVTNTLFNLLDHFPDRQFDPAVIASFNASIATELERIRDYAILHYRLSPRTEPFWAQAAAAPPPDSLAHRIDLYRASGRIIVGRDELFTDLDWFWVFEGLGVVPRDYDPLVDALDFEQVKRAMVAISQKISADVNSSPTHDSFFAVANSRLTRRA
ncbi:MAG TPA: tryptophan halogenase family protein [Steroidobacteraceae bacterium]|nr:tryptophan halogenase family protein [Steroidobacteraceae bacterium]